MKDFKSKLDEVILTTSYEIGEKSWIDRNFSNRSILKLLFEIGFIKLYKNDKFIAYYEGSIVNIDNVEKVKINDAFISYLGCA